MSHLAIGKLATYVAGVRCAYVANAGAEVLGALGDFFSVDNMYWFRPATLTDEHDHNYPYMS